MGTNYYVVEHCTNPCGHCQMGRLHVGKSSMGWRFLVNADDMGTRSWRELRRLLKRFGSSLVDEYDDPITAADLIARIEAKAGGLSHGELDPEWMSSRLETSDGPADFTEGGFS